MKYSFLLVFILAHLIGDFVLQTDKIANLKSTSVKGVAVHSAIIIVIQVLLLSTFGLQGALLGTACGIIHFFIDFMKGKIGKTIKAHFLYFVFDQMMHFAVMLLLTLLFAPSIILLSIEAVYIKIPIILIILVFVSNITAKTLIRDIDVNMKNDVFFKKGERLMDAIVCSAVFLSLLIPLPFSLFLAALGFYPYTKFINSKFGYSVKISVIKYSVYILISFTMILFLRLG